VEESLSLYPSLAAELEPLLRTAADLSSTLQLQTVPPYRLELGRQRFLAAASTRARARALTSRLRGFDRSGDSWGSRHWGLLAGAAASVVAAVVLLVAMVTGGGGGSGGGVSVLQPTATPAPNPEFVANVHEAQERLKILAEQEQAASDEDIAAIGDDVAALVASAESSPPGEAHLREALDVLAEQERYLQEQLDTAPPEKIDLVRSVLGAVQEAKKKLELPPPTETPAPTETPSVTPTAVPEPTPAPTGGPGDTPTPGTAAETPPPEVEGGQTAQGEDPVRRPQ
jgi:hypothetical protein